MKPVNKSTRLILALILTGILLGLPGTRGVSVESGIDRIGQFDQMGQIERLAGETAPGTSGQIKKGVSVGYASVNGTLGESGGWRSQADESVPSVIREILKLSISERLVRRQIRELGSAVETVGKPGSKSAIRRSRYDASYGNR